jgi:hypothetical protein
MGSNIDWAIGPLNYYCGSNWACYIIEDEGELCIGRGGVVDAIQNPALVIFAAVLPILIALIKQAGWTSQTNAIVAFACYIVVGVAGALMSGAPVTLETAVQFITTVTLVGSTAYKLFWSNFGVTADGAKSVEERVLNATSFISAG